MENKQYYFLELLEKVGIKIPIIQRDYAQGREETQSVRDKFLDNLFDVISNGKSINLDFVYGTIKDDFLIPLDGQQRLTTLFLLHYYLGITENKDIEFLKKFTYETRLSSREFCNLLIEKKVSPKEIKNQTWFFSDWENDPTIKSMLIMLKSIEEKFKDCSCFDNLKNITFSFLNLKNFNLTDELYIKMNARGKQLNEFENFKSHFEKFIKDPKTKAKLDNEWLDFFWNKFKNTDIQKTNTAFYNFIKFLAEMISYKNGNKKEFGYDFYEIINILSKEKEYFINVLNNLNNIDKANDLFSTEYKKNKITLLDDKNLFLNILTNLNKASLFQKIILFQVINYILKFGLDDGLNDYIRVVRNVLWQDKYLKQGQIIVTTTISIEKTTSYLKLFEALLNKDIYSFIVSFKSKYVTDAIELEKEKAKLIVEDTNFKEIIFEFEDLEVTKGDIKNFLNNNIDKFKTYLNKIKELFNNEDSLIIRAMLTIDNYSIFIGWTDLDDWKEKYYFGRSGYWDIIVQAKSNDKFDYKKFWQNFLDKYNEVGLEKMIANYLDKSIDFTDWRYYFIKYKEFSEKYSDEYISNDKNIFTFYEKDDIWCVQEKLNNTNVIGYHINPFIYTVNELLEKKFAFSIQGDNLSYLEIEDNSITFKDNKWEIEEDSFELINDKNLDKIEIMITSIERYLD